MIRDTHLHAAPLELTHLLGQLQDELAGRGLFEGLKASGEQVVTLQQQIDQWQLLLAKFD